MSGIIYQTQRELLSRLFTSGMQSYASVAAKLPSLPKRRQHSLPALPPDLAEFNPLANECFQHPYEFYRTLRDRYPIYQLPNGVWCISRYHDIVKVSRDTDTFSSQHQGVVANLKPGQDLLKQVKRFDHLTQLGIIPADVLATSDPPLHTSERKVGHAGLGARYVQSLEKEVTELCHQLLDEFMAAGNVEFMQGFAWRLPMQLIIKLLGLPQADFVKIKAWCVTILESQNGIQNSYQLARSYAAALTFLRYCWRQYLQAKKQPADNLLGVLTKAAADPNSDFDDRKAVSAVFQLIIAGSDSSATTMGNAIKLLIENPDLYRQLQNDPQKIPAFIEEVFRLESAFQGHFRWTRQDAQLQNTIIPKGSRLFLMWASGNRDERFWDNPDELIIGRANGKKHLTFGHGVHACLGRELARMEIRVVLTAFLARTQNLRIIGDTPYVASMFARTLVRLPIAFEPKSTQ